MTQLKDKADLKDSQIEELLLLIEQCGVANVLTAMQTICNNKADEHAEDIPNYWIYASYMFADLTDQYDLEKLP